MHAADVLSHTRLILPHLQMQKNNIISLQILLYVSRCHYSLSLSLVSSGKTSCLRYLLAWRFLPWQWKYCLRTGQQVPRYFTCFALCTTVLYKWQMLLGFSKMVFYNTGMIEMLRKINLSRAMRTMQELFPDEYDFYPRSWILPEEHQQFSTQV